MFLAKRHENCKQTSVYKPQGVAAFAENSSLLGMRSSVYGPAIYSWYYLPDVKHDQKSFIRIPSLNVPEMRPLGTFYSILSNDHNGNDDCNKNFDFSFG